MHAETTCWTLIRDAADGDLEKREEFARRYTPVLRTYFAACPEVPMHAAQIEDAVQDVFLECFRRGGVLDRADDARPGGFRSFLFGVVRNVGLRVRSRRARQRLLESPEELDFDALSADDTDASRAFDAAWAESLVKQAASLQEQCARAKGEAAIRRVELLRLRFFDDLPIRHIAQRWEMSPTLVHREYAKARAEFRDALREIVRFDHPGTAEEIEARCLELLAILARQ